MATPRNLAAKLALTHYFHCTSRCVRSSYLCGVDRHSGTDYSHRRKWLRQRLLYLASCFSIKIAAFTIMENHFHVVLRVEKSVAESWSDLEVVQRWHKLFKGNPLSQRFSRSDSLTRTEHQQLATSITRWRDALADISWFMRCSKEPLARLANKEDGCKGRFWEGRFHSQALLDSRAVIACMTYVDLNPVRALMSKLPENDIYTSFHYRARQLKNTDELCHEDASGLLALNTSHTSLDEGMLPINLVDYVTLVDETSRQTRPDKKGVVCTSVELIVERLGIRTTSWQDLESKFATRFHRLVGGSEALTQACAQLGQRCAWGQRACHQFFDFDASG